MPDKSLLDSVEQVWVDFRTCTMAAGESQPYGLRADHWIGTRGGKIVWIEPRPAQLPELPHAEWIFGEGKLLTPGLIDSHTHCIFGGNRADEWEQRLLGESYQSIAAKGGGILSTVRATRAASEESLLNSAIQRLHSLISQGVTTLEIKSGYGLDLESELKMLRVANTLAQALGFDVEATLLAAHTTPPEYAGRSDDYIDWVCAEMIPAAVPYCSAVDVFCESIAFSVAQSIRVLQCGLDHGLKIKAHAEQLSHQGFAPLAAELGAISIDHLEYLQGAECLTLKQYGTVATLLPGAFYFLRERQAPPVRELLNHEVPIAVATDCNPGSSPILSLPTAANMACVLFGLTPEQAFAGITRHAAKSLRIEDRCGTLEVGKDADFAIWRAQVPAEIIYYLGGQNCITTYKRAKILFKDGGQL